AELPGAVLVLELLPYLRAREPLPGARVRLPQPPVVRDGEPGHGGQLGGRVRGADEVRGDDRVRAHRREEPRRAPRLGDARLRHRHVGGALEAAVRVPLGLAVAPQDELAAPAAATGAVQLSSPSNEAASAAAAYSAALPRVFTASSGRSSCGQSF